MPIPGGEGSLYFATGIDNSGLMRGKQQAVGIIRGMASQISKADVFAGLAIAATVAFAKVSKEMKAFSEEFEHSMKEVQTISSAVQGDFEGYSDAIIDLTKEVPQAANELSKAYYQIVSAGYDGAAGMNLLEISAKAAVGGVTDVTTAADGLTTVMNAWKISTDEANRVSDVFFNTVKLGKTTFGELASNIAQAAPLAAAYGVAVEQIFSATATLTKQGTPTAQAMTQIRAALISVNEKLGEGWSKTMTFQEALVEVAKGAKEAGDSLQEYMGGRVEGTMAVLGMTGENARGATEDLKSFADATGAAGDAFRIMIEDSINQSLLLKNNLMATLKPLGDFWAGKSTEFAKKLNTAFASGDIEKFAKYVGIATASLVAYSAATKVATISKISFLRAIVRAKNAMLAFNLATKANPIGLVVAGITAATAAFIAFRQRTLESSKEVKEFFSEMNKEINTLDGLFTVLEKTTKGTDAHKDAIVRINEKYGDYLTNLLDEKSTLEDIKKAQDEAKAAAISRIAESAKAAAMEEAITDAMNKQGELQLRLYKHLESSIGADAASIAVKNLNDLGDAFHSLRTKYEDFQNAGVDNAGMFSQQADKLIQDFVDMFNNGEDFDIVWNLANQIHIKQGNLDAKEREVEAFYAGFIKDLQEGIDEESGDGDGSKGGFKILDTEELDKQIQAAKKAYAEWEQFKETSQAGALQSEYQDYLDLGATYEEYLSKKLSAYQGNKEQVAIISKELASIEYEEIKAATAEMEKFAEEIATLAEEITKSFDSMVEDSLESMQKSNTDALKKYHSDILKGQEGIAKIAARYAGQKELLNAQLKELSDYYKKARIPMDRAYYKLREKIIKDHLSSEVRYFSQGASAIFSEMGNLVGQFNEDVGQSMNALSSLVSNVGTAVAGFLTGNFMSAIPATIGAISSIIDLFRNDAPSLHTIKVSNAEKAYQEINKALEITNRLLDDQYALLDRLNGEEWLSGSLDTTEMLNDAITEALDQLHLAINAGKTIWSEGFVWTLDWNLDDFQSYVDENLVGEEAAKVQAIIDQIKALRSQDLDLGDTTMEKLTGTTADALSDSLAQAFEDGKLSAKEFADFFEDTMKQAILQSFKNKFIESQMEGWYDSLSAAMDDGELSLEEQSDLENQFKEITDQAKIGWDALTGGLGLDFGDGSKDDPNSLSGAIRKDLTEGTGSLLAGRMNTIMLDTRTIAEATGEMADHLAAIELNTVPIHRLNDIASDISQIKSALT